MRKLLILLALLVPGVASAQNGFFYQLDPPAPNANLVVCVLPAPGPSPTPCTSTLSAAALFSNAALTQAAPNPVQLGPAGTYGFWVSAGQYVIQLSGTVSRNFVVTLGGGSGGAGTLPRLDQVLNQNTNKLFNQGGSTLGFTGGPGLNLSGETSALFIPQISGCPSFLAGGLCFDPVTNNYLGSNGSIDVFGLFSSSAVTSGHVAGFLNTGGTWTLSDLGATSTGGTPSGQTIISANITNIREGDSICFDVASGTFVNCTEGVPVNVQSGTTYTVDCTVDRGSYIVFTNTSPIAVTLPQATSGSSACDANFFTYMRTINADVTVTPTTSTITDGGPAGATTSVTIHAGYGTNIFSDNTNYFAKVGPFRISTNPFAANEGYDITTVGRLDWAEPNNGTTGTSVNTMACNDGTGKAIICPFATSTTNDPEGVATTGVVEAPGTTGNVGICAFGFCTVFFDNAATANHFAQLSSTTAGYLHDVGATAPTNGQAYWHVWTSNSGANTTGVIRITTMSELTAAAQNGAGKTTVLINNTQVKPNVNFSNGTCETWGTSNSGNTTTVTPKPCHGLSFSIYNSTGLTSGTTTASVRYMTIPFGCTINAYNLAIDTGTITVKFWKVATGTAIPTSGNSINTSGVAISSGTAIHSTTLSDFTTTTVTANDIMAMDITAVSSATFVNGVLACQE
jgi:hypothetical protein